MQKLTWRQLAAVGSMLFGLFFGAGNLIFPVAMGQLAGRNLWAAAAGFLITGVGLPLLGVAALGLSRESGLLALSSRVGRGYGLAFTCALYLTIGPFFAIPRCATVSYTVGIAPLAPGGGAALGVFSLAFFAVVLFFSLRPGQILTWVGKVLNPLFLAFLAVLMLRALAAPLGQAAAVEPAGAYRAAPFATGLLEGYNTMDALAGLAFGVTVVTAVRQLGQKRDSDVAKVVAKSGIIAMSAVALIYVLLIVVGAMTLGHFKVSADGGVAFTQLVNAYAGRLGQAVLAVLITVTCLTTAVGLVAAFAQDFHKHFPKLSYHAWLFLTTLASFLVANFGLEQIIAWSTPMLMFLYPLAMVLILLSVASPLFKRDGVVYFFVVLLTIVPALGDMVVSFPSVVSASAFGKMVAGWRAALPLASYGLSWLVPALVGLAIGLSVHWYREHSLLAAGEEN